MDCVGPFPGIGAAFLLLLAIPTASLAQHEEYERRAFESWLASASCDELKDEALFLGTSLTARKDSLRSWKMGLRVQLGQAHRRYAVRCIQGLRYWSYECLSIQRTMGVLRGALEDDELVSDISAERRMLIERREKIEERRPHACVPEVAAPAGNSTAAVEPEDVPAVPKDAHLEIVPGRVKTLALELDGSEVSGRRWVLTPGRHSLRVQLRARERGAFQGSIRMRTVCELSFDAHEGGDYVVTRRIVDAGAARGRMLIAWISRRDGPEVALGNRRCEPANAAAVR